MSKWKTRDIVMAVAIGCLFGTVATFIPIFILTHDEPGFTFEDKSWDSLPVTVSCSGYVPSRDEDCDVAERAIASINHRVGLDLLESVPHDGRITITIGVPVEPGWTDPGGTFHLSWMENRFTDCDIATANTGNIEILAFTLKHELGHCLGLDHDPQQTSIMREVQTPANGGWPPRISDSDRALLRQRYGR